jgi:hypothetical protein
MNTDFKIIWDFLERTGPEVIGHAATNSLWPDAPLVERFISADLTDEEKRELCDFLKTHPHYIQYLVGRLRHAGQLTPARHGDEPAVHFHSDDENLSPPVF